MWFGELPVEEAQGCYLAHSLKVNGRRLGKGSFLESQTVQALQQAGIERVTVARLQDGDLHEDEAALMLSEAIRGQGLSASKASTGRVNLHAEADGLFLLDRQAVLNINQVDQEITFATLAENTWVRAGRMVATIKIIPYAVRASNVRSAIEAAGDRCLSVIVPKLKQVSLIQTQLSTLKPSVFDKTRKVTERRLESRHAALVLERRCEHSVLALTQCIRESLSAGPSDWLLIVGASAISDLRDVIPAALEAAGGNVLRYGLPVDPGNLLMLGELEGRTVLGLPGCARSPKYNGLDQLLDRLACDVPIDDDWLNSLAVGGLLVEELDRPQPRVSVRKKPVVAGMVLAAGRSRRMGTANKLLIKVNGQTMLASVVSALVGSVVSSTLVVTGHEHERVSSALANHDVEVTYNPEYQQGMGHSLSHGISRLNKADAVVVCLGDMPLVSSELINRLIDETGERAGSVICVPAVNGKRGNPVMVGRAFFDTLLQHGGDSGARFLMQQYPDKVIEIEVDDGAIFKDYDTPESIADLTEGNDLPADKY